MQIRCALAILVVGTIGVLPAQAQEIFTVEGVRVDATAGTAAAARKAALASGHIKAMQRLLQRIVLAEDVGLLPPLTANEVAEFVRNFQVSNERTSSVRYLATLTFQFAPGPVRDYLRERGVRFAERRSNPVLLLPVFGAAGEAVLWEDPNPWRDVWATRDNAAGLVPIAVPLGDLNDVVAVASRDALNPDNPRLQPLAQRYGAEDVLVSQALIAGDPSAGTASVQVITTRSGRSQQERTRVISFRQAQGERLRRLLARAAEAVATDINESWKNASRLRFESEQELMVLVRLRGLDNWLEVKRRLENVPAIEKMRLVYLSTEMAQVHLSYYGDVEQLASSLEQRNLQLVEAGGDRREIVLGP